MGIEYVAYFMIAAAVLSVAVKLFAWPIKILGRLIINGAVGVLLLLAVNAAGQYFSLYVPITWFTALAAGIFGIPGVIVMVFCVYFS